MKGLVQPSVSALADAKRIVVDISPAAFANLVRVTKATGRTRSDVVSLLLENYETGE